MPTARAGDFTFTSVDDDHIAWDDPANWSGPGALPGAGDDATISPGLLRGAEVKDERAVNTLTLDSGLNVYAGGKLTVGNGITANAGYFINDGIVVSDVVNNNYIASTGQFFGDVVTTGNGATINDGADDGRTGVWTGDVVSNTGYVVNSYGIWNGDVLANTGIIDNANGAVWNGNVTNAGDFNSTDSTLNGNLTNSGAAYMTGVLNGNIRNSGTVWMDKPLSGVGRIVNTGRLGMEDGAANDVLSAKSWSGTGVLTVDFDPATMSSDKVVLSGDYSADTTLDLRLLGDFPAVRTLGAAPIIVVGGKDSGSLSLDGLPEGGVIAYALVRDGSGWAIAATPGAAVGHVADILSFIGTALGTATQSDLGDACGRGVSLRGFRGGATSAGAGLDFSGAQLGIDLACLALPQSGATLGVGLTLGVAGGTVEADYSGVPVTGRVDQRFAGLSASLVDGAFRAIFEGQLAGTTTRLADPQSGLDAATLEGLNARLSGTAGYALALGPVSLTPELGLAVTGSGARAADFAEAGAVRFSTGPTLAAHTGVTLAADLALGDATTLSPFAGVSLHGDLVSAGSTFTDSAGTSAALATPGRAPYVAVALGANLVHAGTLDAGLRADLHLAAGGTDTTLSGHLKVAF